MSRFAGNRRPSLARLWDSKETAFGDLAVVCFVLVQCLDGIFTYLGMTIWGAGIEANPLVSSAVKAAGLGPGLAGTKLIAIGLGILLHHRRVHHVLALLTVIYFAAAILPWTAILLTQ